MKNYQEHAHARVGSALTYSVLQRPGLMLDFNGDWHMGPLSGLCLQGWNKPWPRYGLWTKAVVTTTIRLWFDARSTRVRLFIIGALWRNPLATVTLTYLLCPAQGALTDDAPTWTMDHHVSTRQWFVFSEKWFEATWISSAQLMTRTTKLDVRHCDYIQTEKRNSYSNRFTAPAIRFTSNFRIRVISKPVPQTYPCDR